MDAPHPIVEWYRRFFDDTGPGDSEDAVSARETSLGVKFPVALRAMLLHTGFRNSLQLHLRVLDQVELDGGVLVFADEQQACGFWGIRREDLQVEDPPLMMGAAGEYHDDGCRLGEFLRYMLVINRCYEAPCTHELDLGERQIAWDEVRCGSKFIGGVVFVRADAALTVGAIDAIGAKTTAGLKDALLSLGEDFVEDLIVGTDGPRKMPTPAEQVRQFADFTRQAWVVPPEAVPVLGVGPVTKMDAFAALRTYCKVRGLMLDLHVVSLDRSLKRIAGAEGSMRFDELQNKLNALLLTRAPPGVEVTPVPVGTSAQSAAPGGLLKRLFGGWFGL